MKKILTLLLAALGLNTACSQNFENMEVKEFAELIADSIACHTQTFRSENVVILDVRKADEFAEGHVKGAILIDQFQSDFVDLTDAGGSVAIEQESKDLADKVVVNHTFFHILVALGASMQVLLLTALANLAP